MTCPRCGEIATACDHDLRDVPSIEQRLWFLENAYVMLQKEHEALKERHDDLRDVMWEQVGRLWEGVHDACACDGGP